MITKRIVLEGNDKRDKSNTLTGQKIPPKNHKTIKSPKLKNENKKNPNRPGMYLVELIQR